MAILGIQCFVYIWLHTVYFTDKVSTARLCGSYKYVEYYVASFQYGNLSAPVSNPPAVDFEPCPGRPYSSTRVLLSFSYYSSIVIGIINGAVGAGSKPENIWNDALNQVVTTTYFMRTMCLYALLPLQAEWDDAKAVLRVRTLLFADEGYFTIAYASIGLAGVLFCGLIAIVRKGPFSTADLEMKSQGKPEQAKHKHEDTSCACSCCGLGVLKCSKWARFGASVVFAAYYCYILASAFVFYVSTINFQGLSFGAFLMPRGPGLVFITYTVYGTIILSIMEFLLFKELNPSSATGTAFDQQSAYLRALVKLSRYDYIAPTGAEVPTHCDYQKWLRSSLHDVDV